MDELEHGASDRSRMAGIVALLAGVSFLAGDVLGRAVPDVDSVACVTGAAYLVNLVDLLKYGLTGIALLLLVWMLGDRLSRLARVVGQVAAAGFVVTGIANGIEHCAHLDALGLLYVSGLLIGLVATAVFGVLLARSHVGPSWTGWVISLGIVGYFVSPEQGKPIVIGIAWIAVGVGLVASRSAARVN
jgi:hypothetical protein